MDNQIVVNGITYTAAVPPDGKRIVVLQRGWIVVGDWTQTGEEVELTDASVIRVWGTTNGLGELRQGPTSKTVLDPCGTLRFHVLTVVLSMIVDKW